MINFINKYLKKKDNFRFPPDPNGYLHFGHIFSIFLNKNLSKLKKGNFFLRFDNTNIINNYNFYYRSIKFDLLWLSTKWNGKIIFFLNKINFFYKKLLFFFKKKICYYKKKTIKNRFYLNYVKKINILKCILFKNNFFLKYNFSILIKKKIIFRKTKLYRHWIIKPTYDYSQSLNDKINFVSISICTNEFKNNSKFYHYFFKKRKIPIQIEFKKKTFKNEKISKRYLKKKQIFNLYYLRKIGITIFNLKTFTNIIGISNKNIYFKKKIFKKSIFYELNYLYKNSFYIKNFLLILNIKKNIIIGNLFNYNNINLNFYNFKINYLFKITKKKNIFFIKKKKYIKKNIFFIKVLIKIKKKYYFFLNNKNHYYQKKKFIYNNSFINNVN